MTLERKDTTADGGNDEAEGWDFEFASLAPAWDPPDCQLVCWFTPLLVFSKCSCCYQSENKNKVTAWEMPFQNYPFGRTKQTMPNVLALNVWCLIGVGAGHYHSGLQMYWVPASSSSSWSKSAGLSGVKTLPLTSRPSTDEIAAGMFAQEGLQRPCYQSRINKAGVQRRGN